MITSTVLNANSEAPQQTCILTDDGHIIECREDMLWTSNKKEQTEKFITISRTGEYKD